MVRFVIVPPRKHYRVEMCTQSGDRRLIARYNTADEAIERRRMLQQSADDIKFGKLVAKGI